MNLKLEELQIYKISMVIGEQVHELVSRWDHFNRDTLGKQLVRSADSIALNISEGYGRFFYKENKIFCYYSRGSAKETVTAIEKAYSRKLISEEEHKELKAMLSEYFRLSYYYIQSIGTTKQNNE